MKQPVKKQLRALKVQLQPTWEKLANAINANLDKGMSIDAAVNRAVQTTGIKNKVTSKLTGGITSILEKTCEG